MITRFGTDYWLEIPAGRYRVGLTPDEAHGLAQQSAAYLDGEGPEFSNNDAKMMRRAMELVEGTGNPKWVERYLLAHHPAREVDLPAFAIAKRPITNREYRQFMAETSETQEPEAWSRDPGNKADDLPAHGISWWLAVAIAEWAEVRLPFEDEWERAVRGADHRLFPWGNDHLPVGRQILQSYPKSLPTSLSATSDGLEGAVSGAEEWCSDFWSEAPGVEPQAWNEEGEGARALLRRAPWARVLRGGSTGVDKRKTIPSALYRESGNMWGTTYAYADQSASVRLVRRDARFIPPPRADTPRDELAMGEVRAFESKVLGQAFQALHAGPIAREHTIVLRATQAWGDDTAAGKLWRAIDSGEFQANKVRNHGVSPDPKTWVHGMAIVATSRETVRRIPREHGIFLWNVQYRLTAEGKLRARPIVVFHMAFNRGLHRFENRFRPYESDTALEVLTPEMVRVSVLDTFQSYEMHADSDENPFSR